MLGFHSSSAMRPIQKAGQWASLLLALSAANPNNIYNFYRPWSTRNPAIQTMSLSGIFEVVIICIIAPSRRKRLVGNTSAAAGSSQLGWSCRSSPTIHTNRYSIRTIDLNINEDLNLRIKGQMSVRESWCMCKRGDQTLAILGASKKSSDDPIIESDNIGRSAVFDWLGA